jgi:hypothetical protein
MTNVWPLSCAWDIGPRKELVGIVEAVAQTVQQLISAAARRAIASFCAHGFE